MPTGKKQRTTTTSVLLELIPVDEPERGRCVFIDLETPGGNDMLNERMRKQITEVCKTAGFEARIVHTQRSR